MSDQMLMVLNRIETKQDRIEQKQDEQWAAIDGIKKAINDQPCKVHQLRLTYLEKITYGAVGIILIGFLGYLIPWSKI